MGTEYENSSSTIEKLTLLVFIAAIVIGNVSFESFFFFVFKKLFMISNIFHLALCFCNVCRTCRWQTLVEYVRIGHGVYRFIYRWFCTSNAFR